MLTRLAAIAAVLIVVACSGGGSGSPKASSSRVSGVLPGGLIAYVADQGVGVIDPSTGKSSIVASLPPGAFRVGGPVWASAPNAGHPDVYFTIHDDRPAETRNTSGVVPYDWLFRIDPFAGTIEPIAASLDSQSEGPIGLYANTHYIALTVGCCASYEVDVLDLMKPAPSMRVLSRPPAQPAFFTEGIAPGDSGLIAVRQFGTGAWYWLNADANVLNPFPLGLGPDDGPVAISPDGTMAAVAMPDHGAVIEPINSALPIATPSATGSASPSASAHPTSTARPPHSINSKMPHPDGLAWSPDGRDVAVAVNGEMEIYSASSPDGTAPVNRYLGGGNVIGLAWSGVIEGQTFADVKPSSGLQATVDALLAATRLPAAADTPANRPLTRVYVWQFDSSRASPIASITDATPDVLAKFAPLNAGVVIHHWAATDSWALLGGCYRYRIVITGSIPPVASTVGLASGALCSAKATPSVSASSSPSHS